MNGIEKITDKILGEARETEKSLLANAEKEAAEIRSRYEEKIAACQSRTAARIERETADILSRAETSAENRVRNLLLEEKCRLLDEVYKKAYQTILTLPQEAYFAFLLGVAVHALNERAESEKRSRELDGEEGEKLPALEICLSGRDAPLYGQRLLSGLAADGRVEESLLPRVRLGGVLPSLDGGLILRCGELESNCSLAMLIAGEREAGESGIRAMLFA